MLDNDDDEAEGVCGTMMTMMRLGVCETMMTMRLGECVRQ